MLQAPCPRCGEPSEDGLCPRCVGYVLRFDPYALRPGLPGPSFDRVARKGPALLTLNPEAPVRFAQPSEPTDDDPFALRFLRHVGVPDGSKAILTRGDREVFHRLFRRWARAPPADEDVVRVVRALYAGAASFPGMPSELVAHFRSLAGIPETPAEEIPPPGPEPEPEPEPQPEPEPEPEPEELPAAPPEPVGPAGSEPLALETLKEELERERDEFARWLDSKREELEQRVESRLAELQEREAALVEKERRIREEEERTRAPPAPPAPPAPVVAPRDELRERAAELLEAGRREGALALYDELLHTDPQDAEAWFNRAEVLAVLNRKEEAIASLERVVELNPDHKVALGELANLLFERGEFGQAAATLADLLARAPSELDHWLRRAAGLLAEGKATEATLIYNAVLEADSANLAARLALGDLLLAMGDVQKADREYSEALQHHPESPEALLKKALLLNRQGRWGAAIQLFNRAISLRFDYREAWAAKGQVYLAHDRPREALECFDKLVTFEEGQEEAWLGKAHAHLALGEADKAAESARKVLAIDANNEEAKALLERLRRMPPPTPGAAPTIAVSRIDSGDTGLLGELANALLEAGDPEGALRGYEQVLAQNRKDARAWFGKGRALHALERYEEAVEAFATAVELAPAQEEYARWLAVCRERLTKEGSE